MFDTKLLREAAEKQRGGIVKFARDMIAIPSESTGERTVVERAYSRLKDEFGACSVRVRGHAKVHLHLMLGVITLFADQWLKLAAT